MQELKKLPVGFENFQEIRKLDFYYVDKTKLVEQLLENWSKNFVRNIWESILLYFCLSKV